MTTTADPASQANAALVEELYRAWKADPASVGKDWQLFFQGFELGFARPAEDAGDGDTPRSGGAAIEDTNLLEVPAKPGRGDQQRVDGLIYAYRDIGHTICKLDPLDLNNRPSNPLLGLDTYGLSAADLDREFAHNVPGIPARMKLRDLLRPHRRRIPAHPGP